jgi:hypothetical protein
LRKGRGEAALRGSGERPEGDALVLPAFDGGTFRARGWGRILRRARLPWHRLHDMWPRFASHFLTAGIPSSYIGKQLAHGSQQRTALHAQWMPDDYVEPMRLESGEVPVDLLARLAAKSRCGAFPPRSVSS